ncbi:MAG TPA: YfhO family protein, partial [Ferruginibacter sp.]|nr:YfhO family protein [Ferruginibacter sp.]
YSYVDFLPYYQRSGGASLTEANQNPLDPLSVISFLFPFSVTRDHTWLQSNPTARSLFIGLVPVLSFAVYRFKKFTRTDGLIFAGVFFFFLFSLGDATPIRSWCYQLLPGMNYFRHPGTMRLFAIIGILFLASRNLSIIYHLPSTQARSLWRKTGWTLLLISIAILILAIIGSVKWLSTISQLSLHDRQDLKWAYDHIGFYQALMLDTVLLSCLLVGLLFLQKKGRLGLKQIFLIQIVHLLVSAQWTIPFTMVSQVSPTAINRFIQQSPNHLPAESWQQPVQVSTALEDAYQRQYGAASVYLKHVCWINPLVNPSIPNRLRELDSMPVVRAQLFRFPVFYGAQNHPDILMDDHDAPYYLQVSKSFRINALELQPNDWQLSVTGEAETRLCVCQNYNANWQVQIDGKNARVEPGNHAFMSVLVPAGNHRIRWHYELPYLNICVWIGILTMLVVVLLTGWPKRRSA